MTPKLNCLECKHYDECEQFSDGYCPLSPKIEENDYVELNGTRKRLIDWSEHLDVSVRTLQRRIQKKRAFVKKRMTRGYGSHQKGYKKCGL